MSEIAELIIGRYSISQYDIDHIKVTYTSSINKRSFYICGGDFESLLGAMLAVKEDSNYVESKLAELTNPEK